MSYKSHAKKCEHRQRYFYNSIFYYLYHAHTVISKNSGNQELIVVHKCALKNTNITNPVWLSNWTKILC